VGLLKFDSPSLVTHASIQIYSLTNVVSTLWNRPIATALIIYTLSCSVFFTQIITHVHTKTHTHTHTSSQYLVVWQKVVPEKFFISIDYRRMLIQGAYH